MKKGRNFDMSTTQPIRNKKNLEKFKNYYYTTAPNLRNCCIITVGLNTALRINDILHLKYEDVFQDTKVREHITVRERKTGKENRILLNKEVKRILAEYRNELIHTEMYQSDNPYLFPSPRKMDEPLSRFQAYRMISAAAQAVGEEEHVSCHSLRKTFGYHAWKRGKDPMVIMVIFNHSSLDITKRYLCLEQDDKDAVYRDIAL